MRMASPTNANANDQVGQKIMDIIAPNVSKPSKMFFLIMANEHLSDSVRELWQAFFQNHERGANYEVILHCQNANVCREKGYGLFADVIDTVKSSYCEDLVHPMLALLETAVSSKYLSRGPDIAEPEKDIFMFLSDTTVPVKSFQGMQSLFLEKPGKSSMCVEPWETGKHGIEKGTGNIVVKHSQWITLIRGHASLALNKRNEIPFPPPQGGQGCADEFWFFVAIFGALPLQSKTANAKDFHSSLSKLNGLNSDCYTFFDMSGKNITNHLIENRSRVPYAPIGTTIERDVLDWYGQWYPDVEFTNKKDGGVYGSHHLTILTLQALQEWNASPLAFIRKVDDRTRIQENMPLSHAFVATVFQPNH